MNKKFFSNTFWILGGTILKALIGLAISIFTARYLGPSNYGIIGYVSTIINLFSAIATLGLANVLIKEYVQNKEESGKITGTAITLQFISSFISYICIVSVVFLCNMQDKTIILCAFVQGCHHMFNCFDCINYYYQSKLQSKVPVIISLIAYILVQGFKVYLFVANKGVVWFSLALCLEPLFASICLLAVYIIGKGPRFQFSKQVAKRMLKQSVPFIIAGLISVAYASVDKIMLKEIFNRTDDVGFYNVGYSLSHSWVFLLSALISSFSPIIYEAYKDKDEKLSNLRARQLYFIIFTISFIVAIMFSVLAPFAIPTLYTTAYNPAIIPSILLVWSVPFAYIGVARIIQITSEELQRYVILFSISTVVLNIILNSIFIPKLGATGAALATLISEIFVCAIVPLFFKKTNHIGKNIIKSMFGINVGIKSIKQNLLGAIFKKNAVKQVKNINLIEGETDESKDENSIS